MSITPMGHAMLMLKQVKVCLHEIPALGVFFPLVLFCFLGFIPSTSVDMT